MLLYFFIEYSPAYSQTKTSYGASMEMPLSSLSPRINTNNNLTKISEQDSSNNLTADLLAKLFANNLESHLQKAGAILNVTAKLSQVRNTSSAYMLNQTSNTLHGIPQNADIEKRDSKEYTGKR